MWRATGTESSMASRRPAGRRPWRRACARPRPARCRQVVASVILLRTRRPSLPYCRCLEGSSRLAPGPGRISMSRMPSASTARSPVMTTVTGRPDLRLRTRATGPSGGGVQRSLHCDRARMAGKRSRPLSVRRYSARVRSIGLLVLAPLDDAGLCQGLQPRAQHAPPAAQRAGEIVEAAQAVKGLAQHQHRPFLAQHVQGAADRAVFEVVEEARMVHEARAYLSLTLIPNIFRC